MRKLTQLNEAVTNYAGEAIVDNETGRVVTAGNVIANSIARSGALEDVLFRDDLARKLYNAEGELVLEEAELRIAEEAVTADQTLSVLAKAAALRALQGPDV